MLAFPAMPGPEFCLAPQNPVMPESVVFVVPSMLDRVVVTVGVPYSVGVLVAPPMPAKAENCDRLEPKIGVEAAIAAGTQASVASKPRENLNLFILIALLC